MKIIAAIVFLCLSVFVLLSAKNSVSSTLLILEGAPLREAAPSIVTIERSEDGSFHYMVNGTPEIFIGMGYNPIYRNFTDDDRTAYYRRDFQILCKAGVNHILGWDFDKGVDQDKFDEQILDIAHEYGIGVMMPFYLPPNGDYTNEEFLSELVLEAANKVGRFKNHPALRMWGVGNEVMGELSDEMRRAFVIFYLKIADIVHYTDPDHPVIFREAEDPFVPEISAILMDDPVQRPWLLYGANVYSLEIRRILDEWPQQGMERPLFVTEFGADPAWDGGRTANYVLMWREIRSHPEYVLGGAPYAWTTEGPELTDKIWGLMDANAKPVDGTFQGLTQEWLSEERPTNTHCSQEVEPMPRVWLPFIGHQAVFPYFGHQDMDLQF
ncbi:MAG: hypothetical protein EXR50_07380 [Dehalococcoidia bacterium]|nr:hypothetical protein [Dehalococcoidia bacterium]